jgi:NAD(P)-dependent dehydrogenase (short-subunit alcohol dehydrogenase family)
VQVVSATRDAYVTEAVQVDIEQWAPQLWRRRIVAGHWVPRERPEAVARAITDLIVHVEGGVESRELRRARATGRFEATLAVVTGAGSGIGRATALALADRGADLVLTDINLESVTRTAELARVLGVEAHAYAVDVGNEKAMRDVADEVLESVGVPDLVVNNAGIGMAGSFVDTSHADWERVLDVNLWGVIHGCQAFVPAMVARGQGGQVVNIASAAAYLPSRGYPAYATTKAAVLQLTACLRAELAADGIVATAICPGIVNSNISGTTTFVGLDETEQKRRQQRASGLYKRRNFTPERTARDILRGIERGAALVPVTTEAKVGLVLSRLTPELLRTAARYDVISV